MSREDRIRKLKAELIDKLDRGVLYPGEENSLRTRIEELQRAQALDAELNPTIARNFSWLFK